MKHISDRQLSDSIDGALSAAEQEFVDTHCVGCAACAERKEGYLAMQRMLRSLPPFQAPADEEFALTRIRARIDADEREAGDPAPLARSAQSAWRRPIYAFSALASTALVAFALIFTLTYGSAERDLLSGKTALAQGPIDSCVVEQETDDIIMGYQSMRQLYYF